MARFQLLTLDGGGIRGVFSAALLADIEKSFSTNITDHFDLIVGTSTRWYYKTRPNVMGREYDVLINYLKGHEPRVLVIASNLNELSEKEVPHIYHSTIDAQFRSAVCLCLYMKKYGEWDGGGEYPS